MFFPSYMLSQVSQVVTPRYTNLLERCIFSKKFANIPPELVYLKRQKSIGWKSIVEG